MITVKEMVKDYLVRHKLSGLTNSEDCGCSIDDLITCDNECHNCVAGVLIKKHSTTCRSSIEECQYEDDCVDYCVRPAYLK